MVQLDLFFTFRTAVFVGLAIYTGISLSLSVGQAIAFLRSDDPRLRFVRGYVGFQLASTRLRPLAGELVQIALLIAVLATIWWAHTMLRL